MNPYRFNCRWHCVPGRADNREGGIWPCQAQIWGLGWVWTVASHTQREAVAGNPWWWLMVMLGKENTLVQKLRELWHQKPKPGEVSPFPASGRQAGSRVRCVSGPWGGAIGGLWTGIEVGGRQASSNSKVSSPGVGIWGMGRETCQTSWCLMTLSKPLH